MITKATKLNAVVIKAEDAWMDEIFKAFPHQQVRYTSAAQGEPGTSLREAYDEYKAACDARWEAVGR